MENRTIIAEEPEIIGVDDLVVNKEMLAVVDNN